VYEIAKELGWKYYDELNMIARDGVELPDGTTGIPHLCEGGDNKYLNATGGGCGCGAECGCNCCTSRTSSFHLPWESLVRRGVIERTFEWQVMAAHAELEGKVKCPYVCHCCKKKVTKEEEPGPSSATTNARLTW
jgi:hypothetical protein